MYEKAPANIQVVFPMKHGVISKFDHMQYLLQGPSEKGQGICQGIRVCDRGSHRCDRGGEESLFLIW